MNRTDLLDEVIHVRGFEDKYTIMFGKMCEEVADDYAIFVAFISIMTGIVDKEEEDKR